MPRLWQCLLIKRKALSLIRPYPDCINAGFRKSFSAVFNCEVSSPQTHSTERQNVWTLHIMIDIGTYGIWEERHYDQIHFGGG